MTAINGHQRSCWKPENLPSFPRKRDRISPAPPIIRKAAVIPAQAGIAFHRRR
jgi:hypothetical protein